MKAIIKKLWVSTILISFGYIAQAQVNSNCPNLNFNQQNFNNWVCKTSSSNSVGNTGYEYLTWTGSTPDSGRHTIMTDIYGYDPHTCNGSPNAQLALIPDGFNQSARIGNDYTMYEADCIIYQMTVDTNNALFLLHFAVVFHDPSHPVGAQPNFDMRIQDANGILLNFPCNRYRITCDAGIPGFQDCSSQLHWRDWTTFGVSLLPLIGQTIYIVIATADCAYGGHYGYAYVVGECAPMKINAQYCCGITAGRFEAPDGFVSYIWRGPNDSIIGTNQKLTITEPKHNDQYSVTMTSAMGCSSTITHIIECDEVYCDFICDSTSYQCYPSGIVSTSMATSKVSDISYWEWNISKISENVGTEYVSGDSILTYFFKDTGYYKILHIAYNEAGCGDTASVIVYSYPNANIDLKITAPSIICKYTETEITASGADAYEWKGVKRVQSDSSAMIDQAGMYIVKGSNAIGCAYDTVYIDAVDFNIRYTGINNKCVGYDSGEIKITAIIGNYLTPISHYWEDLDYTNGPSLDERKNLPTGIYVVYSIDNLGCSRYDTIEIKDPQPLVIGRITGDTLITHIANYSYYVQPVQGADSYHWLATENGKKNIVDTVTANIWVVVPVLNYNPIELSVYAFNSCDSSDTATLLIQNSVNITEKEEPKGILLFPNPTSDQLNIQSVHGIIDEVKIYDMLGKEVKKQIVNASECSVNLSNLYRGLYIVRIKIDNSILTRKVVKN